MLKQDIVKQRFIPVHTGNIMFHSTRPLTWAVYPCAYREHIENLINSTIINGLSLCIQGTCSTLHWQIDGDTVYPCAYREHELIQCCTLTDSGLSLCIQGTCVPVSSTSFKWRFIPVHTGNMRVICLISEAQAVYPCAYREHSLSA